jgi:hypothetical protein
MFMFRIRNSAAAEAIWLSEQIGYTATVRNRTERWPLLLMQLQGVGGGRTGISQPQICRGIHSPIQQVPLPHEQQSRPPPRMRLCGSGLRLRSNRASTFHCGLGLFDGPFTHDALRGRAAHWIVPRRRCCAAWCGERCDRQVSVVVVVQGGTSSSAAACGNSIPIIATCISRLSTRARIPLRGGRRRGR